jgi:hypothetical protein
VTAPGDLGGLLDLFSHLVVCLALLWGLFNTSIVAVFFAAWLFGKKEGAKGRDRSEAGERS